MAFVTITNPRKFWTLITAAALFLIVVIFITSQFVWDNSKSMRSGELKITEGLSATAIWQKAVDRGFSTSTLPWRYHAWRLDAGENIKTGVYNIEKGEKIKEIINRLISGDSASDELSITFPEGFTLAQIAKRVAARGIVNKNDFITAAQPQNFVNEFAFLSNVPPSRDLEGYLFPDTYRFLKDENPHDVISRFLINFDNKFTPDLIQEARNSNRTLDEIIIMASIIEREVTKNEDMGLVSGILWKRYDDGVGLAADATIRYALDKWDKPLTYEDLQTDSPYNTRKYRGLPPTPICNPGLRAIIAAVRLTESDYYYYLSTPEGETIFSKTNAEHNTNKAKYLY